MRLLLDTHSFLWFAGGNERLSAKAKEAISDVDNAAYLSEASLWEMAIKINIGKLKLPKAFDELVQEATDGERIRDFTVRALSLRDIH